MKIQVILISIAVALNSASLFASSNLEEICQKTSTNNPSNQVLSGIQETFSTIDINQIPELNSADSIIYDTGCPRSGYYGYDLFDKIMESSERNNEQSVAIRFTPEKNYQLTNIALWVMNNATEYKGNLKLSLREDKITDAGYTIPADEILYSWTIEKISAEYWTPELEIVSVNEYVILEANKNYWLVAESDAPKFKNPIWNISGSYVEGYITNTDSGKWNPSRYATPISVLISGKTLE